MYSDEFAVYPKLSSVITKMAWSPILFNDGVRLESNFKISYWCALDFDNGVSIEEAQWMFRDNRYILAPTRHHSEDHPKFRLCIPWETPIDDLRTYRHNMHDLIGMSGADKSGVDGARFFYPSRRIYECKVDGSDMPVYTPPPDDHYLHEKTFRDIGVKFIPEKLQEKLEQEYFHGNRNNEFFKIGCELWRNGYDAGEIEQILKNIKHDKSRKFDGNEIKKIAEGSAKTAEKDLRRD